MTDSTDDYPDRYDEPETSDSTPVLADGYLRSEDHAWWASRWHTQLTKARLGIAQAAANEINRIRYGAETADAPLRKRQQWFQAILEDYARRVRAADPKRTHVTTPYGVISTVRKAAAFDVDVAAALEWAESERPDLVHTNTERKVLKSEVVKLLTLTDDGTVIDRSTGELVEWAWPTEETLRVTINPDLS